VGDREFIYGSAHFQNEWAHAQDATLSMAINELIKERVISVDA
jgi:siderophore synthetase component